MPIRALATCRWARHPLPISCMLTIPPYSVGSRKSHPSRMPPPSLVCISHWPKTEVQNLGTVQPLSDVSVDARSPCVMRRQLHVPHGIWYLGSVQTATADLTSDVGLRLQRQ